MVDWANVRRNKWANEDPPADWPPGIRAISMSGTSLFGLDTDGRLYWDGRRVVLERRLRLRGWELGIAIAAAIGTLAAAAAAWYPILVPVENWRNAPLAPADAVEITEPATP